MGFYYLYNFLFVLGILVIIFFLESPRYTLQHNVDSFLEILRGIAKNFKILLIKNTL